LDPGVQGVSAIHTLMTDWRVTPRRPRFTIKRLDHPHREVHIHPALLQSRPLGRRQIKGRRDILTAIERPVKPLQPS
jgi:hypothetical protein